MDFLEFVTEQWLLVSLLIILIFVYTWTEKVKSGKPLSIHGLSQMVNRGEAVVVDIRETGEYKTGHIVDSINIPFNKVADRKAELKKYQDKTLVLVDKMGIQSGAVGRNLRKDGYTVMRLEGGIAEWQNQKLPLVKG